MHKKNLYMCNKYILLQNMTIFVTFHARIIFTLKFDERGFTIEYLVQLLLRNMQMAIHPW